VNKKKPERNVQAFWFFLILFVMFFYTFGFADYTTAFTERGE